jgi:signal transduction histidine kinase
MSLKLPKQIKQDSSLEYLHLEQENQALWRLTRASEELYALRGTTSQTYTKTLDLAIRLSGANKGLLLLANPDSGLFEIEASHGFSTLELDSYLEIPLFDKEYPILIDQLKRNSNPAALADHPLLCDWFPAQAKSHSHVLAMKRGEELEGLLLLSGGQCEAPVEDRTLTEVLYSFAQHALVAVTNARLFEQLKGKSQALEAATVSLVETEKLALAGQMSGSVAHQLRNPLSVISASVQLLMQDSQEGSEEYKAMELVCQKVSDMDATISVLQELAKPLNLNMKLCEVSDSLRTIQRFISQRCASQGVELALGLPPDLPKVWMDETRFQRGLLDLCVNALQELPKGGHLVLAAANFGTRVEVRIEDDGPGIANELLAKLFEPFFSTKAKGSGLGLYNVKRVADAMGVTLEVRNLEPRGASFRFNFIISQEKPQPILTLAVRHNALGGKS